MKKAFFAPLLAIGLSALMASCASLPRTTMQTMQEASLQLQRDQYIIIGRISESATVTASTSAIEREEKNFATGIKERNSAIVIGDNGNYGFIGSEIPKNLTVKEKAVALATYRLLETAKQNNADAVLYVTKTLSVKRESRTKSRVTATVSALAVQVKSDVEPKLPEPPKPVETQTADAGTASGFDTLSASDHASTLLSDHASTSSAPATGSAPAGSDQTAPEAGAASDAETGVSE